MSAQLPRPWIRREWSETGLDICARERLSTAAQAVMGMEAIAELLLVDADCLDNEEDPAGLLGAYQRGLLLNGLAALARAALVDLEAVRTRLTKEAKGGPG